MASSRAAEGTLKDFYQIVSFLLPGFSRFILNRSLVSLVYESLKLVPVYLVKLIVDHILLPTPEFKTVVMLIGFVLLSLTLLTGIEISYFGHVHKVIGRFQRELLEKVHHKLMHLPLAFHEKQNTGAMVSKVTKAASYIAEMMWFLNNDIIPTIFQIVLTSALLVLTNWQIGVVYLVSLPIILHMVISTNRLTQPYRQAYHHSFERATGELAQSLYNVKTVKDYIQEQREHEEYSSTLKEYAHRLVKRWNIEAWRITWREILTNTIRAVTMVMAVWYVLHGSLTAGDLVLIFTLTEKAFINIHRLGRVYNFLGDAQESLSRARHILEEKNAIESPRISKESRTKVGAISFRNVNFSYGSEDILTNVNLNIPAKKVIAVIGESGSGKSTLVKLITRHYDVTSGRIMLDDIDLRDMSLNKLRKRVAVVSQHSEIFNRTIKENIAYGKPHATKNEVIEAAKKANAHEFITKFKDKYETLVGEKGVRLSGGQQQRLSIARALLTKPEILIFDEATSSLDSESEAKIQKALFANRGKSTMIIIAHRLSTIENADIVVVMGKGRIAEIGTHQELLNKKDGLYRKMRKLQRLGELRA